METNRSKIKIWSIILGIVGYVVLCFPWYELTSEASILGYTASMSAGEIIGLSAAGQSFLGYGLYVIPALIIAVGCGKIGKNMIMRKKSMTVGILGIVEVICLLIVDTEMASYATDNSGFGASASAGFTSLGGYSIALIAYVLTAIVGFVLMFKTPEDLEEEE